MLIFCLMLGLVEPPGAGFAEVAEGRGVSHLFENGSRGRHDLVEIMGGGVGLIDFDNDGRLDLYLTNGGPIAVGSKPNDPPCRLYRNIGGCAFQDVTAAAGAPGPSYAMGVAVGDYDGDGRADLFVTGWRDQRLYHNNGDGTFTDVTSRSGLASDRWSTSAAFADLDGDGDLDLYVCSYVDYDPAKAPFCRAPDGKADYCGPGDFPDQPHRLYRNNGDGTFTDLARKSGILDAGTGRGLGVLIADLAGDSGPDIFVANDGSACWLFENQGGFRFKEIARPAGVAYDAEGNALAAMGVACGDADGDGLPDLFVGNLQGRSTIAFRGIARGRFHDESQALGLTAFTRELTGFGLALADLDGDGALDILQANGHVLDRERLGAPFRMPTLLLANDGRGGFRKGSAAGPFFAKPILGRGLAVGDLDRDGRPDIVISRLDGPAAILQGRTAAPVATLNLISALGVPNPPGARIRATVSGKSFSRLSYSGGSYLSAGDTRPTLPLNASGAIDTLEISWPSGALETRLDLKPRNGEITLREPGSKQPKITPKL